jgi:hypothetical protein
MMDFDSFEEGSTDIEKFEKNKGWRKWMWIDVIERMDVDRGNGENGCGCGWRR